MDRGFRLFVGSIAALLFLQTASTNFLVAPPPPASNPFAIAEALRAIEQLKKSIANYRVEPYLGENPGRDPIYRGGFWNDKTLASRNKAALKWLGDKAYEKLFAIAANPFSILDNGVSGGGSGLPGEGRAPGGGTGGIVNTNTGNRMLPVNLVGWQTRGGLSLDFTLYHNSQTDFNQEFGPNWSFSFGARLELDTEADPDIATIRWGDGLEVAFTDSGDHVNFNPPAGFYDKLVKNGDGTWLVTSRDQTKTTFNTNGMLSRVEDRNGNAITVTFSGSQITAITDPTGRAVTLSYTDGKVSSITDPANRVWTFTYNGNSGDLLSIGYPELSSTVYYRVFTYDIDHRILSEKDLRDKVWYCSYDGGKLVTLTDPLTHVTTYSYNTGYTTISDPQSHVSRDNYSSGILASQVDEDGYSVSYVEYDSNRNLKHLLDKRSKDWLATYDSRGNMLTRTDPNSKVWTCTYKTTNELESYKPPGVTTAYALNYDSAGNLLSVYDPLSRRVVLNTYDGYGQLLTTKNALDDLTTFAYSTNGHLNSVKNHYNKETTAVYDVLGRITSVTNPVPATTSFYYDQWGRNWKIVHPDTNDILVEYDQENNVTKVTDERDYYSTFTYDNAGRLTDTYNGRGDHEVYGYNNCDCITTITNGNGATRTYTYTNRHQPATLTMPSPDSGVETWTYNQSGDLASYTNALNQTIQYGYDNASRLNLVDYPTGTDTSFTYNDRGLTLSMADSTGTSSWTYNDADEVTALSTPQGSLSYTYDGAGRPATMVQSGVGTTTYTFDHADRLTNLNNPYNENTAFQYDNASRMTRRSFHNGAWETYAYDSRSRLTTKTLKSPPQQPDGGGEEIYAMASGLPLPMGEVLAGAALRGVREIASPAQVSITIQRNTYTYDAASNILSRAYFNGSSTVTTSFTYDQAGQLLTENRTGYSASYTFDNNGNRLTRTVNSATEDYTVDAADRLTQVSISGIPQKTITYDAAGRTKTVTTSAGQTTLDYDYENRVTQLTYPSTATNTFAYNGVDARTSKTDSSGTSTYLRNGVDAVSPVLNDGSANYTPGISERRSSTSTYTSGDLKNSTRQLTNYWTTTATKQYDAYGNVTSSTGTWNGPWNYGGGFGYQSDAQSELMLLGHRYYDAGIGRFATRDSIKHGANWYSYCNSNPIARTDPTGFQATFGPQPINALDWIGGVMKSGISGLDSPITPVGINPHLAMDIAGMADPTGIIDFINAIWLFGEGDFAGGALTLVGVVGLDALKSLKYAGRLGGALHRSTVKEVATLLKKLNPTWELVAGGGLAERRFYLASEKYRYPDIWFKRPDGTNVFINVGRTTKGGEPVWRERSALSDLAEQGTTYYYPWDR